jgi:hypothetical protein
MAALSYASAIPIVGWWTQGAKMAHRIIVTTGGKTALKWVRLTNNIVSFGDRRQLRRVLGITSSSMQAHHIIPWEFINHEVVQAAAKTGNPFHMNELLNGIALDKSIHIEGMVHAAYNTRVANALQVLKTNLGPNINPLEARQELGNLINNIRTAIQQNPGVSLNNIIF